MDVNVVCSFSCYKVRYKIRKYPNIFWWKFVRVDKICLLEEKIRMYNILIIKVDEFINEK